MAKLEEDLKPRMRLCIQTSSRLQRNSRTDNQYQKRDLVSLTSEFDK